VSIEPDVEVDPEHALELFGSEAPDAAPDRSVPRPVPSTFELDATIRATRFFERVDLDLQGPQAATPSATRSRSYVWLLPSAAVAFLLAFWFVGGGEFQLGRSSATGPPSAADRPLPKPSSSPQPASSAPAITGTAPSPVPVGSRGQASSPPTTNGLLAGTLSIDSRPVGASVFIDEQLVGTTPMLLPDIAPGTHVVRLQLAAHQDWTSTVQVVADGRNRVTAALEDEDETNK
jgi:hypothetical protein